MCKCNKANALSILLLDVYKLNECLEDIRNNNYELKGIYSDDSISGNFIYF